jgi:hypothetical protein
MIIKSGQGDYPVDFVDEVERVPAIINAGPETFVIIDEVLVDLYGQALSGLLKYPTYRLRADEESKTLTGVSLFVVGELAELVRVKAGRPEMPIERQWDPEAEADRYVADPAAVEGLARRFDVPVQSLPDQVAETDADLHESEGERA